MQKSCVDFEVGAKLAEMLKPKIISKLTEVLNEHMEVINSIRFEITQKMQESFANSESEMIECIACSQRLNKRGIQQHCSRKVFCILCNAFEDAARESCKNIAFIKNLSSIPLI